MCSIIGYNGKYDKNLVEKICFNSRIRGLHSFGYTYSDEDSIITLKYFDYEKFINSLHGNKPEKFIAHFRYSTSGNYKEQSNNQPIQIGAISMVFNGVLDMGTKQEMEKKYNCSMLTDNDGELAILEKQKGDKFLKQFINQKTFAGIFLESKKIKAIRNENRPCYKGKYNNIKLLVSTKDILIRSGVTEYEEIKPKVFVEL